MNAHPICRIPIWLAVLSTLVLYAGGINGSDTFGLMQVEAESFAAVDVLDDDTSDPLYVQVGQRLEVFRFGAAFGRSERQNFVSAYSSHMNAHRPTGPPLAHSHLSCDACGRWNDVSRNLPFSQDWSLATA